MGTFNVPNISPVKLSKAGTIYGQRSYMYVV